MSRVGIITTMIYHGQIPRVFRLIKRYNLVRVKVTKTTYVIEANKQTIIIKHKNGKWIRYYWSYLWMIFNIDMTDKPIITWYNQKYLTIGIGETWMFRNVYIISIYMDHIKARFLEIWHEYIEFNEIMSCISAYYALSCSAQIHPQGSRY